MKYTPTSKFVRMVFTPTPDTTFGSPTLGAYPDGAEYWGQLQELTGREIDITGRVLSNTTAKIVMLNRPPLNATDRLRDKRTDYIYQIDGISSDYQNELTTAYCHRLEVQKWLCQEWKSLYKIAFSRKWAVW
jgi:hypothetical protein